MSLNRTEDIGVRMELSALLNERILVADGATGTALEALNPTVDDFGGEEFIGCNEMLNLHAPHIVKAIHKAYIEAGADLIFTDSFNGSPIVLEEFGIADRARELARLSGDHAHAAIGEWGKGHRMFVVGSMGPGTKSITVTGGADFDDIRIAYREYSAGLLEGGADILLLETVQDTLNLKAAITGIAESQEELDREAPLAVSVTIEAGGTMLAGQNIEALYHTLSGFDLLSLGLNCATGPAMMTDHLRALARISRFPVSVWPNAGLPDEDGKYSEGPELFREIIGRFAGEGFLNIAGGCCGTTPEHITAIKEVVSGVPPRRVNSNGQYPALASAEQMVVEEDNKPVYIGERTNTIGSRKFKRLIGEGNWDEAAEIGREQMRKGAMALDVCTADPDRDEVEDFANVLKPVLRKVRIPIMIDTTDTQVVLTSLKSIGGKPAINSVNLEDGGERLRETAELAKKYAASLVCGLIDDDPEAGMAVTVKRKLEIAGKIYEILVSEMGIPKGDIIFDPLVFPAATGDPNYIGAAEATINGTKAVKEKYPDCLTVLGVSNVSFGLPLAGREVVNSVFLYHCVQAGLDMAIVNTARLKRYPSIPELEKDLAMRLLMQGDQETIKEFTALYRGSKQSTVEDDWADLSTEEKVSRAIVEARKTGLEDNLSELLPRYSPLEIINGPLLSGMDEVGKLFAANSLIVAEVLESAEVMKAAVDFLKPHFPPGAKTNVKGKMLLATVKGDVHDIGKNLVDMILSNNGFDVINLGIKIAPETIIEAVEKHKPDMIGLSGLLVRSAQQMVHTATDLTSAGIDLPLMVGGAALSKKFSLGKIAPEYKGTVFYAAEAMDGLTLANGLSNLENRDELIDEWSQLAASAGTLSQSKSSSQKSVTVEVGARWIETDVPDPPDLDEHVIDNIPVDEVLPYLNENMLFGKHLGVKSVSKRLADPNDEKIAKLRQQLEDIRIEARDDGIIAPKAIYRWFKAATESGGILFPENENVIFKYPRQSGRRGISAVDWVRPTEQGGDHVALFVVSAGLDTVEPARRLRDAGRLLDSHLLQALAIELAEATAEWLHKKIRVEWGIADDPELSVRDLFSTKYRGIRLSFGYPACPDLADQERLFQLLKPEKIGVTLTEGYMMSPEAAVSAVVFHHPEGKYYAL